MSDGDIERLIYYKGQVLTADDFNVQQDYHRNKFTRFVQRFPRGIVTGLHVVRSPADKNNPDDYDAFKIEAGLAFDEEGNTIVVPERGYRISIDEFIENKPYINLLYKEETIVSNSSTINGIRHNNRIRESIYHEWTAISNKITTVAKIRKKKEGDESKIAEVKTIGDLVILEEEEDNKSGKANIRKNAGILGTDQIEDDAIIAKKIANGAVESAKIAANAVDTTKLANNAVHSSKIAESAIGTRELADNAVGRSRIQNAAITADKIAPDAVTADKIANLAVSTPQIADNAVNADKLANNAVHSSKIAENAIGSRELADNAVSRSRIQNAAITADKIAPDAVTADKIANLAVSTPQIADNAVNADKLANNAVHSSKIAENAVGTRELADNAVSTVNIADAAVNENKLAPDAITSEKIATGAVTGPKIADNAVSVSKIQDNAVRTNKIQNRTVSPAKLSIATEVQHGTIPTGPNQDVTIQVEPEAIISVIPTTGKISWTTTRIEAADGMLTYVITIKNEDNAQSDWRILKVNFGSIGP